MKKRLIFFSLVVIHASGWGQKVPEPKGNCTDALAMKTPGKWIKWHDNTTVYSGTQLQEAYSRLDIIHRNLTKMVPQPVGVDVRWGRSIGVCYFGTTRKYYLSSNNELTFDFGKPFNIASYSYNANFSPHYCAHTDQGLLFIPGEKNENSKGIGITINTLGDILSDPPPDDDWTIDGLPVKMRSPVANEKWRGFEVQFPEPGSRSLHVLIHRNGVLPYKPVSRQQYLDRCIRHQTKFYDELIAAIEKRKLRTKEEQETEKRNTIARIQKQAGKGNEHKAKAAVDYYLAGYKTDEQVKEEELVKMRKIRDAELKKFTDELQKTASEGLLDTPALILVRYYSDLIFEPDTEKGYMLVTENPDYIRKDLPAYIPQMIVLFWVWSEYIPHIEYQKLFEQDFPMQMLVDMIDK